MVLSGRGWQRAQIAEAHHSNKLNSGSSCASSSLVTINLLVYCLQFFRSFLHLLLQCQLQCSLCSYILHEFHLI